MDTSAHTLLLPAGLFSSRCRQFVEMVNGTDSEVCCLTVRSPKSQDSYPGSPLLSPRHGGSNAHMHAGGESLSQQRMKPLQRKVVGRLGSWCESQIEPSVCFKQSFFHFSLYVLAKNIPAPRTKPENLVMTWSCDPVYHVW